MPAGEDDAGVEIVDRPHAFSHVLEPERGLRTGLPPLLAARFSSSDGVDPGIVGEDPEEDRAAEARRQTASSRSRGPAQRPVVAS
jgi:hypothetical protein